MLATRAL